MKKTFALLALAAAASVSALAGTITVKGSDTRQNKLYAWPNIWANEEVVPEKIGIVEPTNIAREISLYLQDPTKLEKIRAKLEKVRGDSGAACKISELVREQIAKSTSLL